MKLIYFPLLILGIATSASASPTPEEIGIKMAKCSGIFLGMYAVGTALQFPKNSLDGYMTGVTATSGIAKALIGQDRMVQYASAEQAKTTQAIKAHVPAMQIGEGLTPQVNDCNAYYKNNEAQITKLVSR